MTWSRGGRAAVEVVVPSEGEHGGRVRWGVRPPSRPGASGWRPLAQSGWNTSLLCVSFACVSSAPFFDAFTLATVVVCQWLLFPGWQQQLL